MQLRWTGFRWELECSRFESGAVRTAGFHHDTARNLYWTGLTEIAEKYRQYADMRAREKFQEKDKQVHLSQKTTGFDEYEIPVPEGLSYMPFQKAGILVALQRFGFNIEQLKKK